MQNMRKWIALFLTMLLPVLPAAAEEESTMLTGKTATEIVEMMGFGWNLGNTLDATGGNTADVTAQEQSWGNAKITPELMVRVKEAGFDTIRIPVTWYRYTSDDGRTPSARTSSSMSMKWSNGRERRTCSSSSMYTTKRGLTSRISRRTRRKSASS